MLMRNKPAMNKHDLFSFNVDDTTSTFMLPKVRVDDEHIVRRTSKGARPASLALGDGKLKGTGKMAGAGMGAFVADMGVTAQTTPLEKKQRTQKLIATTTAKSVVSREVMDEHVRQITANVNTGDDVIEFYARHGHDSPVKFFYCLLKDDPAAFSSPYFLPYDLTVVSRDDVGSEYYTMSASGVVHMKAGMQSEFTPLGEWMREKSIFNILTRLKFFKYYIVYKTFKIWHKNVRQKLFLQVRNILTHKLFLGKATFCSTLMEIYGYVNELNDVKLMASSPGHPSSLEDFAELQSHTRNHKAGPALEHTVERIQTCLEKLCKDVTKQARLYQESIRDQSELEDKTGIVLYQGREADKTKSMYSIKREQIERARTYKRVIEEAKMLGDFVRLIDYMLVEGLVSRTIGTVEDLLNVLESPRNADTKSTHRGVFLTTVNFNEHNILFTPTEDEISNVLDNMIEEIIGVVEAQPRLLLMRSFTQHFQGKLHGLNPITIIRETEYFYELRQSIVKVVREDFAEVREYATIFEEHRPVHTFGLRWNAEEYAKKKKTVRNFRMDLMQQKEWRTDLERMKIGHIIGTLYVDSKPLRNCLIPITQRTLDTIKMFLLNSAREEVVVVLNKFQAVVRQLQERPAALDDFMAFSSLHGDMEKKKRSMMSESSGVDDMYDLLHQFEMKVPTSDQVKLDDLHEAVQGFLDGLVEAEDYIEDRKTSMISTLDQSITTLNEELLALLGELHSGSFVDPESESAEVVSDLRTMTDTIRGLRLKTETYQKYQKMFNMPLDDFGNLSLTEKECSARNAVWTTLHTFIETTNDWLTRSAKTLDIATISEVVDNTTKEAYRMGKLNKEDRVVYRLKDFIDEFKTKMPLLEELANPALKDRHWEEIFNVIGMTYVPDASFSVKDLVSARILDKIESVQAISADASKEYSLEKALDKMSEDWQGVEFNCIAYKDTGTYILGGVDDVQLLLDDQIVKIQSMRASPFIKPFEARASVWEDTLQTLQDMLDNWMTCQATWQYLEPIFASEDIMKQMPEEGGKFLTVDHMYRDIMTKTEAAGACIEIARDKQRLNSLEEANDLLDEIQKGLASYLEVKRLAFPRFFFLSNDEMLEILSETKDPTRVQPHLKKCFEGIDCLEFNEKTDITAMVSAEKERVPLKTIIEPSKANGAVEKWLVQVESGMLESLQEVCQKSIEAYPQNERVKWVVEWPGQVVLLVSAIFWTQTVETALATGDASKVKEVEENNTNQLTDIVGLVRGDLSKLERKTLSALVVMDVHARDVLTEMAKQGINSEGDFEWQSQLRIYYEEETVMLKMMNASIEYGYEYLGNSSRLVITPLTDRCYRTLMGAIHLNLGGAPEGPAGTGKTETTKDLAKALARQCVVFNCSDSLDYLTMAKFFKGLASSGAWACFDEFNRIDLEVLSVVAQQVLEIQLAVKAKVKSFFFEGTELTLRPTCNAFITMNPGYAGRSELPDNLKALFRTVAMMVPDYALISEIILLSNGYLKARDTARKIVATYRLCSEQLSSQDHYDYGMRAVMAVLRAAGNLKRRYPDEDEYVLILRSIIDVNLCKFLSHDVPLFEGITSDLFPGVVLPKPDYNDLTRAMTANCVKQNLQPSEYFLTKVIQLHEMIIVRHGLMLVGLPFSGKSKCLEILQATLTDLCAEGLDGYDKVNISIINPKSVTMGQLYGETDKATQEWKDGVLAVKFRKLASDQSSEKKWVVLDGPVDAIWIENMNTVLDDNKKLCLPNSEIIQMSGTMNMIFEVGDLAVASPATVSRCGMVYLEPHQLGWEPIFASWLATMKKSVRTRLDELAKWIIAPSLRYVRKNLKELTPTSDTNLVVSLTRMFASLLVGAEPTSHEQDDGTATSTAVSSSAAGGDEEETETSPQVVDALFIFSLLWSVGGAVDGIGRLSFDRFLRAMLRGMIVDGLEDFLPPPNARIDLNTDVPAENLGLMYDFVYQTDRRRWVTWKSTISDMNIPQTASFSEIIVPTPDSARYTFLTGLSVRHDYPCILVGPTGTGKSVYVQRYLLSLPKESFVPITVTMSARTSANMTQDQIDGRLDKRRKGIYGPPMGKKAIVFVDDLNMPTLEKYGAQPPIELLRQFQAQGGWYGRDNNFRTMHDVQFVAAMGPAGGGRNPVTGRFLRHYNAIGTPEVSDATLTEIFSCILAWHLKKPGFGANVRGICNNVVAATLDIYNKAMAELLPTPSKSHYTFNLRDFARVIQGVMLMPADALPAGAEGTAKFCRLWVHEVVRVFGDRLVDDNDSAWLLKNLSTLLQCHMNMDINKVLGRLMEPGDEQLSVDNLRSLFFGDYMDMEAEGEKRMYNEVADSKTLLSVLEEYLLDYNGQSKRPMNLAVFLFAAEHISRICRVLKQPGGHMLAVGVGGSGRQSLTRLATHMCGMSLFQVEISKSYSFTEWREDMKKILLDSGAHGKETVFMLSDTQVKDEAFVEDINNILNSGEIPNLYPTDEKMQVMEAVRQLASKQGKVYETPLELWSFFTERCRSMLHIVFCMSPIGEVFRERLRQNPSLVNCCTIDWFKEWPSDALEAVASKFLAPVDLDDAVKVRMVPVCKFFHKSTRELSHRFKEEVGRYNYVTPTSYLELINMFQSLLSAKRAEITKMRSRYEVGLGKIEDSAQQVAGMQEELIALRPELIKTVGEVEDLVAKIEREKKEVVEPKKAIVEKDENEAAKAAAAAKAIKDECEEALAEAIPVLNDALNALDTIKPADINYVKKLGNPPAAIKLVMEAICVILEVKAARVKDESGKMVEDYWKPSVALLNDKDFITMLKTYDKDNIPPKVIKKINENYITDENFTPEKAANASSAAEGMCKWCIAMSKYDKVAKVVAPKRASLKIAEAEYEEVMVGLRGKQAELKELTDKLAVMEGELADNTKKKEQLQKEVDLCTVKLDRAEKLIGGLGGERTRWTHVADELTNSLTNLVGDMIISAGVISYLGAFTSVYRENVIAKWLECCMQNSIPRSPVFAMSKILGDPVKIREWIITGLPTDSFSIDNAIVVANARRWPLLIDPQGQANKWIKTLERNNNLQVIKLSAGGEYLRTLENAIQFGLPVLLEDVGEELDPTLEPVLLKQTFKSGGVNCIRIGDSTIEFSSDFRFYITTKYRNPHYLPEVAVKVTLLNFMITPEGLTDQLLGIVVAKERPDLEEQKNELVVQGASNKKKLKELEDKILEVLSESEGNILEDETAIGIISEAKVLGNEITEKQQLAEETEKKIDETRLNYRPCGEYTMVLFFCITDLGNIDPMYQYSLPWFNNLFLSSIESSEGSDDVSKRLSSIQEHFTYSLYCNVCRSLFEKDKLLFAFQLCIRILQNGGKVDSAEWNFLLTGGLTEPEMEANPAEEWLPDKAWRDINKLALLPAFAELPGSIASSTMSWRTLYDDTAPQRIRMPEPFADIGRFRMLLIMRCLRPDKVVPAVQDFVEETLGKQYVEPLPFNLGACYNESSAVSPLIFVLSAGSDPTAALVTFAEEKEMSSRIGFISLGQGQGPKAAAMIAEAVKVGTWVVLQNCHLAPSWMKTFEKICEELDPDTVNPDFRLWCTSKPSKDFPTSVLQNGVKMTNEPPKGIRANIKRSLTLDPICTEEFFDGCSKPTVFKRMLFGLCFFHSLVQERRKFGALGWNIQYGFDDGDLRISVRQLRMFIEENDDVPYAALRYVTGECNYGGRVTDDKDRILLNSLLEKIYNENIHDESYKFSSSGIYVVPRESTLDGWARAIDALPITPQPEAFGLHENADITKDQGDTMLMFQSLLSMAGTGGSGGGGSDMEKATHKVVTDTLHRLPANFDVEKVQQKYPVRYEESMNTVLAQEMTRFNKLLTVIRKNLKNIDLALRGLVVMSSETEKAYRSICINQVPELWKSASYPSLQPLGSYYNDLLQRLQMLQSWYEMGPPPVFWMSGFFFVQSFLTASMQNYARLHNVPIDMVKFDFSMLGMSDEAYDKPPDEGIYVKGLFLEGCDWDPEHQKLCESRPKVLTVHAPIIHMIAMRASDIKPYAHYNCPVYRTTERKGVLATTGHSTNFVMFIRMPTDLEPSHWIQRGVALMTTLAD